MGRAVVRCVQSLLLAGAAFLGATAACAFDKSPVPSEATRQEALELVKEIFGKERENAKTSEQKQALATKLLESTNESTDDTNRYMLLEVAREVAAEAGDVQLAFRAIDATADRYDVDAYKLRGAALSAAAESATLREHRSAIASLSLQLIDQAVEKDDFVAAKYLGGIAGDAARKAREYALAKQILERNKEVEEMAQAYADVQDALATLNSSPVDPDANLAVGKYNCFIKGNWDRGLPMLALGSEEKLKRLGLNELQDMPDTEGQMALGDGWWDLASANDGVAREQLESRAGYWYQRVLPYLTGLAEERVAKRLEELTSSDLDLAGGPDDESPSRLAGTIVGHFQIGMIQSKTKQRKVAYWEFREDHTIWEKEQRIAEWSATDTRVRLIFSDKALGEATIRPRRRGVFLGQWVPANGDVWACEFQKVFVVSVWEYHWGSNSNTRKLWSNGRQQTPDSRSTWERKGSKIIFRFPSGAVDTCTFAPDGRSFKGRNQHGLSIWGRLISE